MLEGIAKKVRIDRKKYKALNETVVQISVTSNYLDGLAQTVAGQLQMTGTCTGRSFTTAFNKNYY